MSRRLRRVMVLTGAGVSAESGIPTFRGKDGWWRNRDPMELATPEAFARDPATVWEWYADRRRNMAAAQPNPAHRAIVRLAQLCDDFLLVTQNVDDLHERAGSRPEHVVHIHGELLVDRCTRCGDEARATAPYLPMPRCGDCGGLLRPAVVWFGEMLPRDELVRVEGWLARGRCDLALVVGTTALFGYVVDWALRAGEGGELVEVNPEPTPLTPEATRVLRGRAGELLPAWVDALAV